MTENEIIQFMKDGYELHHAPVGDGLALMRENDAKHIECNLGIFQDLRSKGMIKCIGVQSHGHPDLHGIIDRYGLNVPTKVKK